MEELDEQVDHVEETPEEASLPENTEIEASGEEESTVLDEDQYTPNLTFRVMDEERTFDERIAAQIKSKEDEEYYRDLMERAYGLDYVKGDREKLREENTSLQEFKQNYDNVVNDLKNVGQFVRNGDFGQFFDSMNIPRDQVYQWVLKQAELQELRQTNPQQYDHLMRAETVQQQNYRLQQERDLYAQQYQQTQQAQIQNQLQQELSQPDVSEAARLFDERMGQPGAFRQEIANRGVAHFARTGVDLPPSELVNQVMMLGGFQRGQQAPVTQQQTPSQPRPRREVETLPNVSGRSTSPVKKKPRSIDDIRKRYSEVMQNEQ